MSLHEPRDGALPFFLEARTGGRFCLYHEPAPGVSARGMILYVHPFAEELNKSRRMAALQARAYARAGYGVLQIDLYGCGDSDGDFADARWDIWLDDLARAWAWLAERAPLPLQLWGLRLGALLALDFGARCRPAPAALVLWQPVISGRVHLNQFLRMRGAARLLDAGPPVAAAAAAADTSDTSPGTAAAVANGAANTVFTEMAPVEVAGYALATPLCTAITVADAGAFTPRCPVRWLELVVRWPAVDHGPDHGPDRGNTAGHGLGHGMIAADHTAGGATMATAPAAQFNPLSPQPTSALLIERWQAAGVRVTARALELQGTPFWSSAEITESPALLAATLALVERA